VIVIVMIMDNDQQELASRLFVIVEYLVRDFIIGEHFSEHGHGLHPLLHLDVLQEAVLPFLALVVVEPDYKSHHVLQKLLLVCQSSVILQQLSKRHLFLLAQRLIHLLIDIGN
jgi:N-acetylglutamate synthase-like GNAT family acetyltransferase